MDLRSAARREAATGSEGQDRPENTAAGRSRSAADVVEEVDVDLTAPEPVPPSAAGTGADSAEPCVSADRADPADRADRADPTRELAEQLRGQGVVVVASRALAAARPEGVDLLGALGVLTREVAQEWFEAADTLPLLDVDRLQVRSAAALLSRGATAAVGDAVPAAALDVAAVARAAALRMALQSGAEQDTRTANQLLDRTWAVLCDLRRLVTEQPADTTAGGSALGVVPSAVDVDPDVARSLPPALNRAASAGALVGLLAPWLPPPHTDPLVAVDTLLHGVSSMARAAHDRAWWSAMTTTGRVAASLSVAAGYACATGYAGSDPRACALTLSEPALELLVEQAVASARAVAGAASEDESAGAGTTVPAASPSQQARAAAERAAAERRATQQAIMERIQATRAAARQDPPPAPAEPAAGNPAEPADPGVAESEDAALTDDAPLTDRVQPDAERAATTIATAIPTATITAAITAAAAPPAVAEPQVAVPPDVTATPRAIPAQSPASADRVRDDAWDVASVATSNRSPVPPIAQVLAELGEAESAEETEEIDIGVWDTLMRPR